MNKHRSAIEQQMPRSWSEYPNGLLLRRDIEVELMRHLNTTVGERLLAMGSLAHELNVSHCKIKQRIRLDWQEETFTDLVSQPFALALDADCIDIMLMPMLLNYSDNHHQILREAQRVLVAGGKLCIITLNPWGFWGLRSFVGKWQNNLLWHARMHFSYRIQDWLELLQFTVFSKSRLGPLFPWKAPMTKLPDWMNGPTKSAKYLGAVQIIFAEKKVIPMTLLRERWQKFTVSGTPEVNIREAIETSIELELKIKH